MIEPLVNTSSRGMEAHINRRLISLEGMVKTLIVLVGLTFALGLGSVVMLALWEYRYQYVVEQVEELRDRILMNRRSR